MHVLGAVHTYWAVISVLYLQDNVWRVMHPSKEHLYRLFCFPMYNILVYDTLILNLVCECEVVVGL
jgi:hypothetical protein